MALCSLAVAGGIFGMIGLARHFFFRRRLAWLGGSAACGGAATDDSGCHGRRRRRWSGWRGRGIGHSYWLRRVFVRLDTTPGQEREIRAAVEDLADRARDTKEAMRSTRESLARAVSGDTFDEAAFEAVSARADASAAQIKDAFAAAMKRIHATLDSKQRERLAELVADGPLGAWARRGHPYRGGEA
jgi:Spy/CpxP family protein refolding chaperone